MLIFRGPSDLDDNKEDKTEIWLAFLTRENFCCSTKSFELQSRIARLRFLFRYQKFFCRTLPAINDKCYLPFELDGHWEVMRGKVRNCNVGILYDRAQAGYDLATATIVSLDVYGISVAASKVSYLILKPRSFCCWLSIPGCCSRAVTLDWNIWHDISCRFSPRLRLWSVWMQAARTQPGH